MNQWEYARIGRSFERSHPELFRTKCELMEPGLTDTSIIPHLYNHYIERHPSEESFTKDDAFLHRLVFIASIVKLYCPMALYTNDKLKIKIRGVLSEVYNYNHPQSISYYITQARVYIKNQSLASKVDKISHELKDSLQLREAV